MESTTHKTLRKYQGKSNLHQGMPNIFSKIKGKSTTVSS